MDQNEFPLEPRRLKYNWVRPKWFLSLWYVWRKSCTYLTTRLSPNGLKRGSTCASSPRYIQVRPKWFSSLWYVQRKLWTYLASCLALSPNRLKWASTWASSPRSTIGYVQNNFWAYATFGANRAPILTQDYYSLQMDQNEIPLEPHHLGVPSGASKTITEPMVPLAQSVHLKRTEMSFHLSLVT
jgi:hypothetical protein